VVDAWKRRGKRRASASKAVATRRMKRDVWEQRRQSETLWVVASISGQPQVYVYVYLFLFVSIYIHLYLFMSLC
jgi:hypothetical protein